MSELSFTLYGVSDTNQHDGNCWPRACFLSRFVQTALSVIACLNPKQNHMLLRMFFLFKFQIWCESIQVLFLQPCCWPMAEGLASLGEPAPQGQAQGFAATLGARDCSCLSVSDMIPVGVLSALTASPFPVWPLALGSLGGQCSLPLSGHQAADFKFSGHLLLNCVAIERNTITLRDSRAIVNTCTLPSCSILAWSVSLKRAGKASPGAEGTVQQALAWPGGWAASCLSWERMRVLF